MTAADAPVAPRPSWRLADARPFWGGLLVLLGGLEILLPQGAAAGRAARRHDRAGRFLVPVLLLLCGVLLLVNPQHGCSTPGRGDLRARLVGHVESGRFICGCCWPWSAAPWRSPGHRTARSESRKPPRRRRPRRPPDDDEMAPYTPHHVALRTAPRVRKSPRPRPSPTCWRPRRAGQGRYRVCAALWAHPRTMTS